MKEQVRQLARGENSAHGALRQTGTSQGTKINNLVNKEDPEDYFYNLAAAANTEKGRAGATHGRHRYHTKEE